MPFIKICGLTRLEDALVAAEAGADFLGLIFYPRSPRYVTPAQARRIVEGVRAALGARSPRFVGVFVNASPDEVRHRMAEVGLDLVQLHGDEPPAMVRDLWPRAYKALRPTDPEHALVQARAYTQGLTPYPDRPMLLVDAFQRGAYGGTGRLAHEAAAQALARHYPILLAGGLTPDNVADRIRRIRPWGVDVSSGVEAQPGVKDPQRVRAFIQAVRSLE